MVKSLRSFCRVVGATMVVVVCAPARAQQLPEFQFKDIFRNQQLLGQLSPQSGLLPSLTTNSLQVNTAVYDSILPPATKPLWTKKNFTLKLLPISLGQQTSSILPFNPWGGNYLPTRGYQLLAGLGIHAKWGKHWEAQLAPEFLYAQAKPHEGLSAQLGSRAWADRYTFWNTVDIPDQWTTGPQTKVYAGQSFLKYHFKKFSLGVSNQNLWWGPGSRNALVMGSAAPGFWHVSFQTTQPIHTRIGNLEGQIIGGALQASGILPPRIFSIYQGNFVYQPKAQQGGRYVTGLVLTWNPKWTPNLYVGLAKSSYLYFNKLSNPLDFLPLQGFLGNKLTGTEKRDEKASMGSLFFRYLMPQEHAELYLEYGKKDGALWPWQFFQAASFRRAFVGGFRKLFPTRKGAYWQFGAELTQMQAQQADYIRNPDSWYSHPVVRHGYTHLGRPLGAGIGPGSNSQSLEINWGKGLKRIGLQFERTRYQSDFYYYAFEYTLDFRRHWIDLSTTLKADWAFDRFLASAQLSLIRSYNYKWLIIQVDPNDFFAPGNEFLNVGAHLSLRYRF